LWCLYCNCRHIRWVGGRIIIVGLWYSGSVM
jgi:hypothetical protein